jgi:predicted nucleotide-binding protein
MNKFELIQSLIDQAANLPHRDDIALDKLKRRAQMILTKIGTEKSYAAAMNNIIFFPPFASTIGRYYDEYWISGKEKFLNLLRTVQEELEEFGDKDVKEKQKVEVSKRIFIVHGHDEINTLKLKNILGEHWHLDPKILRGEPGKGRTLIEKFEQEAEKAIYAFVLFSPDDLVEVKGTTYTQARPNAIFELGWFYGRLTRQKVCILFKKGTKIPSDLDGITRIEFDNTVDEKILEIERELRAANLL